MSTMDGVFIDISCPNCGSHCGNGGQGTIFHCPQCGWSGEGLSMDDIKLISEKIEEIKGKKRSEDATLSDKQFEVEQEE